MTESRIYGQSVPEEEIDRLRMFDYPTVVSLCVLDGIESLQDRVLLDAGSGSNNKLAQYTVEHGALYIPVDLNIAMMRDLLSHLDGRIPLHGVVGDVRALPLRSKSVDIAHQRFVLMHLSPGDQEEAVRELCRVTKDQLCLLEYDWETFTSEDKDLLRFKEASLGLMQRMRIDPFMGKKLELLAKRTLPDSETYVRRFERKTGNYSDEVIRLACSEALISRNILQDAELSNVFEDIIKSLEVQPANFIPPDIVAVTCRI